MGVKMPARRRAVHQVIAKAGMPPDAMATAQQLWEMPEREYQYCALDLLVAHSKKKEQWDNLAIYEGLIQRKSWWDTVDGLAPIVGNHLAKYPEKREAQVQDWLGSGQLWLIRTAIIFQLGYKKQTDAPLLFRTILQAAPHPDFFVRKAIGWALRQYARIDPAAVGSFVVQHGSQLSSLSKREALRRME